MSGCGIKNTVTIVTYRHRSFGGVQGGLFKGLPCWGAARRLPGQSPGTGLVLDAPALYQPPRESANSIF